MGTFAIGDVVLVAFPYADFSAFKIRPALVVGKAEFNNLVTCQITSKANTSKIAIKLTDKDFISGGLKVDSYIRPDKLFTIEQNVIQANAGTLKDNKTDQIRTSIRTMFN